jgi:two-component system, NarL family, sensor histidine kinase DesK
MRLRLLPPDSRVGWTPFGWLVYLSFFVVYAAFRNTARDWVIDGAALTVFLALYFRGFWVHGAALLRIVVAIVAIGVLVSPRNPGASCFFIYGAAFLGDVARPSTAFRWLAGIIALVLLQTWLMHLPAAFWVPAAVLSLLVGGSNIHFAEVRRKDQALLKAHELAERLARTAERERIARDLHDLLGHTLSVIVLKSELASKLADRNPSRAAAEIREVEAISRNALAEVRRAVHGFRGERFADQLAASARMLESAGVTVETRVEPVLLGPDEERALALGLREAATNVVRHARATRVTIDLVREDDGVTLRVADNGIGGEAIEGAGLSGMRGRVAELGGSVDYDGAHGARLTLRVPARQPGPDAMVPS